MDFNSASLPTYQNSTAFKKIQYFSKTNPQFLYKVNVDLVNKFDRLNNFFINESDVLHSNNYRTLRQASYLNSTSHINNYSTVLDNKSLAKFLDYNFDLTTNNSDS